MDLKLITDALITPLSINILQIALSFFFGYKFYAALRAPKEKWRDVIIS